MQVRGQTMINGAEPVCAGKRFAVAVRNGDQRKFPPALIGAIEIRHIEPAMQCSDRPIGDVLEEREMQKVDVEMQHVELVREFANGVKHGEVTCKVRFEWRRVEPQGLIPYRHKLRL